MRTAVLLLVTLTLTVGAPRVYGATPATGERPSAGDPAPTFSVPLLDGGEFDLSPHLGREVILLNFWSIYCVACVEEMPRLVALHNKYRDQGLLTVGVDLDSFGTKRVVKFVEGLPFQVTYPIVVDRQRQVAAKYGVSVLPTAVVIDRAGRVAYYHVGYSPGDEVALEKKIAEALASRP
ncbi:MAG: TlpA family protein disulfide reductase [Deferrisomatales bacterium]